MAFQTPIYRYYIDTRSFTTASPRSINPVLPLLSTLPKSNQDSICAFIRPPDKYMSLASTLLKFLFIHRTAKIPWQLITVDRTPKPHCRPFWKPLADWDNDFGLEFNVSHHAGLTALIGCKTMLLPRVDREPMGWAHTQKAREKSPHESQVRLGVDVACTNESRSSQAIKTIAEFDEYVDIFAEMFSEQERKGIKRRSGKQAPLRELIRQFYSHWALKEAFIKMIGEGLLAGWLRELEFSYVDPPAASGGSADGGSSVSEAELEAAKWGHMQRNSVSGDKSDGFLVTIRGEVLKRTRDLDMEITAYDQDFIIATAIEGVNEEKTLGQRWCKIDIEKDVRPCAEGRCGCLA